MTTPLLRLLLAIFVVLAISTLRRPTEVLAAARDCDIHSTAALNFSAYDPFSLAHDDTVGSVRYQCAGSAYLVISLSGVQGDGMRELRSGANVLEYNVYADAARTTVVGDFSNGAWPIFVGVVPNNSTRTTYLYGRIPAGQDVAVGSYSASLVVTFSF